MSKIINNKNKRLVALKNTKNLIVTFVGIPGMYTGTIYLLFFLAGFIAIQLLFFGTVVLFTEVQRLLFLAGALFAEIQLSFSVTSILFIDI